MRRYAIQIVFGLLVGFIFFNVKFQFDSTNLPLGFGAVTWATALTVYVFVFKAMYFNDLFIRAAHERANHVYGITPAWIADLFVNFIWVNEYFCLD
jgi:hypothetical protein